MQIVELKEPLFDMGRLVATRAVAVTMDEDPQFRKRIDAAVLRHISGDFGAIPAEDVTANLEDLAAGCLKNGGGRVMSRYHTDGTPDTNGEHRDGDVYIITNNENGTIYTCVLYCNEY